MLMKKESKKDISGKTKKIGEKKASLKKKIGKKAEKRAEWNAARKAEIQEAVKAIKAKHSKYRCATTGKYACERCGKEINRGDTIRMVAVKYADGLKDNHVFCSKECRNAFCDENAIPKKQG